MPRMISMHFPFSQFQGAAQANQAARHGSPAIRKLLDNGTPPRMVTVSTSASTSLRPSRMLASRPQCRHAMPAREGHVESANPQSASWRAATQTTAQMASHTSRIALGVKLGKLCCSLTTWTTPVVTSILDPGAGRTASSSYVRT